MKKFGKIDEKEKDPRLEEEKVEKPPKVPLPPEKRPY
jgi:hypothetical protein